MARYYDVHEVSRLTGLEESRIRFFEKVLGDYLGFTQYTLAGQRFDDRQIATDRISSVQYVKFRLSEAQQKSWNKAHAC